MVNYVQMSIVSENLRFLRKRSRYTQDEMAGRIGIKRSLLGAYEEGRADPRLTNLQHFSREFGLSVDLLIGTDLTVLDDQAIEQLKTGVGGTSVDAGIKVLTISVDQQDREFIDLVPQKASAGYTNGYADTEFLGDLPKFRLPNLPEGATYRAFEISGDSMLPLQPGTIVVGQYLENLVQIKDGSTYVVVTSREGVVYKRVFNYIKDNGKLLLVSDNDQYTPYEVEAGDVLEVWEAKAYISVSFPESTSDKELSMEKLTSIVLDLQKEVIKLKEAK